MFHTKLEGTFRCTYTCLVAVGH